MQEVSTNFQGFFFIILGAPISRLSENSNLTTFAEAYYWLKKSRQHYPPSSDVWDFRRKWKIGSPQIIASFLKGDWQFDVQKRILKSNGETILLWSSPDALILKVLSYLIQGCLGPFFTRSCYHLKGHGGLKGAVRDVLKQYPEYPFFIKTDVKDYYESIDHHLLMLRLEKYIKNKNLIRYIWLFLNRTVEWGGLYREVRKGISRGSSLSPLLGAFYLLELDKRMENHDVRYFRYMDDILILAPTRCKLKKAIKALNQTFNELKLEKHPDKTMMGRTEKGFDFLGYHFSPQPLRLAAATVRRFLSRTHRLYEQQKATPEGGIILGEYVTRWRRWSFAGLGVLKLDSLLADSFAACVNQPEQAAT